MSTVDAEVEIAGHPVAADVALTSAREAQVGDMTVRRLLPLRLRRSVGAWCFVDHYGPMSVDGVAGMRVPPHPHIGLQTVTWLLSGQRAAPGQPGQRADDPAGPAQPDDRRARASRMRRSRRPSTTLSCTGSSSGWRCRTRSGRWSRRSSITRELPGIGVGGFEVTVFLGSLAGAASPATVFSEIVGARARARGDAAGEARPDGSRSRRRTSTCCSCSAGSAEVEGTVLRTGQLLYLGTGREQVAVTAAAGSTMLPARRGAAGRAAADVVELRGPDARKRSRQRLTEWAGGQVRHGERVRRASRWRPRRWTPRGCGCGGSHAAPGPRAAVTFAT